MTLHLGLLRDSAETWAALVSALLTHTHPCWGLLLPQGSVLSLVRGQARTAPYPHADSAQPPLLLATALGKNGAPTPQLILTSLLSTINSNVTALCSALPPAVLAPATCHAEFLSVPELAPSHLLA